MTDLRAYQPSFTAGVLSPSLWARVDLAKYSTGLKTAINLIIHPHGGASNRPGLKFIREVKNSGHYARQIAFQFNTEQSYILEFGNQYFRVFRDGGVVLAGSVPYEVVTPYLHSQLDDLAFVQEADVMYIVHPLHAPRKLSRLADNNWTLSVVTFEPTIHPPPSAAVAPLVGTGGEGYAYRVSAVHAETGEESLPTPTVSTFNNLSIAGNSNRITWSARAGAGRYIVYKLDNGVFGYIGGTSGLAFVDENIVPDLADTPQAARNPFTGAGNYPRCVAFIEQRLGFAATLNDPQAVWLSQSANYENFGYSQPSKASDAVTFRIKARQVNEIRSMIAVKGLMLLTSGAEWIVTGGSQSDAITPSAIKIDNQGYRGASKVQPIVVGNTVLFSQDRGGVIRDFSYQFADDAYVGKDLTILARHLFRNKNIKAWAFAQAPYSIAWVVMDDGSLASLTYMKEHDVWAWTEHESGANAGFEDVTVIAEGNEDVPYFIVRRTINGATKRYIERLHTREFTAIEDAFFVDCGLTYDGAPVTALSDLDHLEGCDVVALSNGNVVKNLTVTGGSVTLPRAAGRVHIGLPMTASLQTLDLDLGQIPGLGTVQGRTKSIPEVTLRVEDTRGIFIGPSEEDLVEWKQRATENWDEAIKMYTGDVSITIDWDWSDAGSIWIKQFDPLPMTILAIMPDVKIGR